ncbi:MAG: hypothetical protein JWN30_988 [Bacilli bacterium]|nr:hypothetical protein [Bacilli bacterium]
MIRNIISVVLLFFPLVMIGCTTKNVTSISNVPKNSLIEPANLVNVEPQTVSTDVYRPKVMDHWLLTMYPNEKKDNFDFHYINYSYQGDTDATNVIVKFGNGLVTPKVVAKGQGGTIGSTFPSGTKQLQLSISWTENNHGYSDSFTFNTGY